MDAFYCGVEELRDPGLRGEPFVVAQKNIAATVSYAARALGVRKLQTIASIRAEHPRVRVVNGEDLAPYRAAGLEIFRFLCASIPQVERLGLEEFRFELTAELEAARRPLRRAFQCPPEQAAALPPPTFRVGGSQVANPNFFLEAACKTWPPGRQAFGQMPPQTYLAALYAEELMARIRGLGYQCSVGIASSKHIAKMATARNKPAGCFVVLPGHHQTFVESCPLASVPGIGHAMMQRLGLGPQDPVSRLDAGAMGILGPALAGLCRGQDESEIVPWEGPRQISKEETFSPPRRAGELRGPLEVLVRSLLAQAAEEMVCEGRWVERPVRFRVTVAARNVRGQGRKSRSILLAARAHAADADLPALGKLLRAHGAAMVEGLVKEPIRVLNVALLFRQGATFRSHIGAPELGQHHAPPHY